MDEDHITTAFFGDWVVDVELENGTGVVFQSEDRHGPHEIVKRGRKEYLSAVIVLRDKGGPLTALVYHNPFTAIALPVLVFEGINCQHFMVPPDHAKRPQSWIRFR